MCAQLKILNRRVALAALPVLSALALVGCASSGGHARRDVPQWDMTAYEQQMQREQLMTHSGDSSAVIFAPGAEADPSWYAYQRQISPEYDRRDGALAVGEPDPTAGWYNWSLPERPSLDDQEYFYSSRNPNAYTYPGRNGRWHGPYHHRSHRSYRTSPYPRRHVR